MRIPGILCFAVTVLVAMLLPSQVRGFVYPTTLSSQKHQNLIRAPVLLKKDYQSSLHLAVGESPKDDEDKPMEVALNTGVGGILLAGGIMGFVKSGSKASLVAGSTIGSLLFLSAFLISKKKSFGYKLGSAVSGVLTLIMGKKYLRSGKFMPAGFIASLGVVTLLYNSVETLASKLPTDDKDTSLSKND